MTSSSPKDTPFDTNTQGNILTSPLSHSTSLSQDTDKESPCAPLPSVPFKRRSTNKAGVKVRKYRKSSSTQVAENKTWTTLPGFSSDTTHPPLSSHTESSFASNKDFPSSDRPDGSLGSSPTHLFKDLREVRKIRSKPRGIDAQTLLKSISGLEAHRPRSTEAKGDKVKVGLSDPRKDADGLLSGFTSVNKTLDANQHMEKFIEQELARKRRKVGSQGETSTGPSGPSTPALTPTQNAPALSLDDELFSVPEHLKIEKPEITEGSVTVSTSMLTSIPEVSLGPETKLKAIQQTEKFREKLRALRMFSNSQLRERALAFHNNPYPSMRWRISRKTRESLYDLQVADEILHAPASHHERGVLHASRQPFLPEPEADTSFNNETRSQGL